MQNMRPLFRVARGPAGAAPALGGATTREGRGGMGAAARRSRPGGAGSRRRGGDKSGNRQSKHNLSTETLFLLLLYCWR